jgi:hypothetical protein
MSEIIKHAPTEDEVLTASLKLVVDRFVEMGYEENIIFGKVNLIINEFITPEGTFTEEYIALARQALEMRASEEFKNAVLEPERPQNNGSGIQLIVPGGIVGGRL